MGRFGSIWAVILLLLTSPVIAQKVQYQFKFIDPGIECQLQDGSKARCYDLNGYKSILKADYDLWIISQEVLEYRKMFDGYSDLLKSKDLYLESKQKELAIYMERSERLQINWNKSEADLAKERNKFSWSSFGIGLGVGGIVVSVVTGAIVLALSLK